MFSIYFHLKLIIVQDGSNLNADGIEPYIKPYKSVCIIHKCVCILIKNHNELININNKNQGIENILFILFIVVIIRIKMQWDKFTVK